MTLPWLRPAHTRQEALSQEPSVPRTPRFLAPLSAQWGRAWCRGAGEKCPSSAAPAEAPPPRGRGGGQAEPSLSWEDITLSKHLLCAQSQAWHTPHLQHNKVSGCHSSHFIDAKTGSERGRVLPEATQRRGGNPHWPGPDWKPGPEARFPCLPEPANRGGCPRNPFSQQRDPRSGQLPDAKSGVRLEGLPRSLEADSGVQWGSWCWRSWEVTQAETRGPPGLLSHPRALRGSAGGSLCGPQLVPQSL